MPKSKPKNFVPVAEAEFCRLHIKNGDWEFDAEGPEEYIKRMRNWFMSQVGGGDVGHQTEES